MRITKFLSAITLSALVILFNTTFANAVGTVSVSPASPIDYGNIESGTQFLKNVEITNTSAGVLTIRYELDNTTDFEINPTPNAIPAIPANEITVLQVTFKSVDPVGSKSGTIKIFDTLGTSSTNDDLEIVTPPISLSGNTIAVGGGGDTGGNINGGSLLLTFPNPIGNATTIGEVVKNVIEGIFGLLGAVAVFMIVYGGVIYMVSGASKDGAEKGKKILTSAVIGLIIVLVSLAIVDLLFVLLGGR